MTKKNETTNYQGLYGCGDLTQFRNRAPYDPYAQAPGYYADPYMSEPAGKSKKNKKSKNNEVNNYPPYNPYDQQYPPQPYDPYGGQYYQDPYYGAQEPAYDYGYGADNYSSAKPFSEKKPVRKFIALLSFIFSALIVACIVLDYLNILPYAFINVSGGKIGAVDSVFMFTKLFGLSFESNFFNAVQTVFSSGSIIEKIEILLFPAGVLICALFSVILLLQSLFAVFGKKSGFVFCALMCLIGSGAMIASLILIGARVGLLTGYLTYALAGSSAFLLILSFVVNRKN